MSFILTKMINSINMFKKLFSQVAGKPSLNPYKLALESSRFTTKYFWLSFFTLLTSIIFANTSPFMIKGLFDNLEVMNFDGIYFFATLYLIFFFFNKFFDYFYGIYATILYGNITKQSTKDVLDYINLHSDDYFASKPSGQVSSEILDIRQVSNLVFAHIETTFPNLINLIIAFILFFKVDLYIGFFALIYYSINFIFVFKAIRKFSNASGMHAINKHRYLGILSDLIGNIKISKIFNVIDFQNRRIFKHINIVKNSGLQKWFARNHLVNVLVFFNVFLRITTAMIFGYLYFQNMITLGDFSMLTYLILQVSSVMENLQKIFEDLSEKESEVRLALSKLITPIEEADKVDAKKLRVSGLPGIEFKNVEFTYKNVSNKQLNKF